MSPDGAVLTGVNYRALLGEPEQDFDGLRGRPCHASVVGVGRGGSEIILEPIRTSFAFEALTAGLLVQWQPQWKPYLALATDVQRPWFPVVFGMLGRGLSTTRCSQWAREVTVDKPATEQLLRGQGLPVPEGKAFAPGEESDAWRYACSIAGSVVVKPVDGGGGRGVTVGIEDERAFQRATSRLRDDGYGDGEFLVQRTCGGRDYRFTVSRARVLAVFERLPPCVTGDGRSSIEDLVTAKNATRASRSADRDVKAIVLDDEASDLLSASGWSPASIPERGEVITISRIASRSRGSDVVQVTESVHPSLHALALQVLEAIPGADIVGIDLILSAGHTVALEEQRATIIEVNVGPSPDGHLAPDAGPPSNLYRLVLEDLAGEAGLRIAEARGTLEVAVRPSYLRLPNAELARLLDDVPGLGIDTSRYPSGGLLVLAGERSAVHDGLRLIEGSAGTVIGVSLSEQPREGDDWLDRVLHPTTLMPRVHSDVLARAGT